jgi:PIN domain nuclease of toxin-antitoxin system
MADFVIDTQIVIWYLENSPRLSSDANTAIDDTIRNKGNLFVPTISIVEIVYLIEKGRLVPDVLSLVNAELRLSSSSFTAQALSKEISNTLSLIPLSTVPDMPDRIIAATALYLGLPLITSDAAIHQLDNVQTIW